MSRHDVATEAVLSVTGTTSSWNMIGWGDVNSRAFRPRIAARLPPLPGGYFSIEAEMVENVP